MIRSCRLRVSSGSPPSRQNCRTVHQTGRQEKGQQRQVSQLAQLDIPGGLTDAVQPYRHARGVPGGKLGGRLLPSPDRRLGQQPEPRQGHRRPKGKEPLYAVSFQKTARPV